MNMMSSEPGHMECQIMQHNFAPYVLAPYGGQWNLVVLEARVLAHDIILFQCCLTIDLFLKCIVLLSLAGLHATYRELKHTLSSVSSVIHKNNKTIAKKFLKSWHKSKMRKHWEGGRHSINLDWRMLVNDLCRKNTSWEGPEKEGPEEGLSHSWEGPPRHHLQMYFRWQWDLQLNPKPFMVLTITKTSSAEPGNTFTHNGGGPIKA